MGASLHFSQGVYCGGGGSGDYSFTFFDLDYAGIATFTATITGDTFAASGSTSSSGLASREYTYTINATKR